MRDWLSRRRFNVIGAFTIAAAADRLAHGDWILAAIALLFGFLASALLESWPE